MRALVLVLLTGVVAVSCGGSPGWSVDGASRWKLQPASASVRTTDAWDLGGGAPDPLVRLWCPPDAGTVTATTPAVSDSFMPAWTATTGSCVMTAGALMGGGFDVAVDDEDVTVNDPISARTTVKLTLVDFDAGFAEVTNGTTLPSLRISLTRQ